MEKVINGLGRKNSLVNNIANTNNKKKGISLIALVIVIIIILILTAAIIITVTSSSPIEEANEAVIRSDIRTMQEMYQLAYSDAYIKNLGDDSGIKNSDFKDVIPDKYKDEFKATSDGIIYVGDNETIEEIAKDMGIEKKEYNIIDDVVVTAGQTSVIIEVAIIEGEVVDSYIYQIREKGVENWTEFTNTSNKLTVEDLKENVEYEIKVVVKQEDKTYESEIITVITSEEEIQLGTIILRLNNASGEAYSENTWTNQNVYVAVEGENTTYSVSGANQVNETTASSTLSNDGVSTVTLKTTSATAEKTQNYTVKIDRSLPVVNELVSSNTTLTNENITLTGKAIDSLSGIVAYQFSTNDNITDTSNGWNEITNATSEITQNYTVSTSGTYYFYVKDSSGNVVKQSIEVSNIDKTNPSKAAPTVTSTTNSVTVTFNQTDENGIDEATRSYAIKKTDETTWGEWITSNSSSYTFENLIMNISYDVKTRATDEAGNTSESEVTTISTVNITKPTITASSDWTAGSVEVTIVYPEVTGATYEYSTNGTSWEEATTSTQKVTVSTNNTTVYARVVDSTGQASEIATYEVTNIDTTVPTINSLTASTTSATKDAVTLTGKAVDTQGGIAAYQFSTDDSLTLTSDGWITITSTTSEITQTHEITENGTYYFYVKDAAGNVEKQSIVVSNIDKTLPTLSSINVTNPLSGTYKAGELVTIVATYSENITGTAPILKIKFGSGAERTATAGAITNNTITYTYAIASGDNGTLATTSYSGSVTDIAGNNLTVTNVALGGNSIVADTLAPTTTPPTLTSNTNSIVVTFKQTDINGIDEATRSYAIKKTDDTTWGEWVTSNSSTYVFESLEMNTSYDVKTKVGDIVGNESHSEVATISTVDVSKPTITASEDWTSGSVDVTIVYPEIEGTTKEYSTNGTYWEVATGITQIVTVNVNNTTVYARLVDSAGQVSEIATYEVTCIDKTVPTVSSLTADITTPTNQVVTLTGKAVDEESGIVAYQFSTDDSLTKDSIGWLAITRTTSEITLNYSVETNETYYFYVKNASGLINKKSTVVDNIDKTLPTLSSINVTSPATGIYKAGDEVTIVATYSENITGTAPTLKVKFGSGAERTATAGAITNNSITYAYEIANGDNGVLASTSYAGTITDEAGNSFSVSNMILGGNSITADTLAPTTTPPTLTSNTNSITATFKQTDTNGINEATTSYAIKKTDDTTWGDWITIGSGTYTFDNLEMNTSYDVKTKASDTLGNESYSEVATIITVNITKPTITASSEWSNSGVEVTIGYPEIEGTIKQYSTDGISWTDVTITTQKLTVSVNNTTVYARLIDSTGQASEVSTYTVTCIDKTVPIITSLTGSTTSATNQNVTITGKAVDEISGIVAYQFSTSDSITAESSGWTTITSTTEEITQTHTVTSNATYYFYVKDTAGNIEKQSITVSNIDTTFPNTTAPTLTSTTSSITATFKQIDETEINSATRAYAIKKTANTIWGEWVTSDSDTYTFDNLEMNTSYDVKTKVTDTAGNTAESNVASKTTVNIPAPTITFSPDTWTNGNVEATITYEDIAGTTKQYSTDGTSWTNATGTIQKVTVSENNTIVYAKVIDSTNQVSTQETVDFIDKTLPMISSFTASITSATNGIVTITGKAIDETSGIVEYQFSTSDSLSAESSGWTTITRTTLETTQTYNVSENGTYYFYVKDAAGNITKESIEVTNIDKTAPTLSSINVTSPNTGIYAAGQVVTIVATYSENITGTAPELKIKFGDGIERTTTAGAITDNTIAYTYTIASGDNGTITSTSYAGTIKDTVGNSLTVSNMILGGNSITADTTLPTTIAPTLVSSTNSITATIKQTDGAGIDEATKAYAIKKTSDTTWGDWVTSDSSSYTFENLTMNISYDVKTKVSDTAGNTSESEVTTITTINITKPTITAPTDWTAGNVEVTIIYPSITGTTRQYSTNGTTWIDVIETTQIVTVSENNTTVYARIIDSTNQTSGNATYTVTCIDKTVPIINSLIASTTSITNQDVTITGKAIDTTGGIVEYQFSTSDNLTAESSGWTTIISTTSEITQTYSVSENGTYHFYVKDVAGNVTKQSIEVNNIDKAAPTLDSISVTSPVTGTYTVGDTITIVAIYSENITGTAPTLKIKFGTGAERTATAGAISNNTITYTYTIEVSDIGVLISTSYTGTITDFAGNSLTVSNMTLGGNTITAKTDPIIQSWPEDWGDGSLTDFHADEYKTKITSAKFKDNITVPSTAVESWDVSEAGNGSVIAYVEDDGNSGYILTIGGTGKVYANENSSYLFQNFTALTEIGNMNLLDTSNVTEMAGMFWECRSLTSLDLSKFDTSKVTDMNSMLAACSSLTNVDVSKFDTSQVIEISGMFNECSSLTNVDVSSFDTSNVEYMDSMFEFCSSLTDLNVSNFNTSNVEYMSSMFLNCSSLINLDLGNFDTSNVTHISEMFYGCSSLTNVNVSGFNTSKVTSMDGMFYGCSSLTNLEISNFDTSNVTGMGYMFNGCSKLTSLDVSGFNTSKVTSMAGMFNECSSLTNVNVSNFDTSNVTSMNRMFEYCSGLTSLDVSKFNTSNVTHISSMFRECSSLTSIDLSSFDTSNVTNMNLMFENMNKLQKVTLGEKFAFVGTKSYLPTPSITYITGADGNWYNSSGTAFTPEKIPNNVADTYSAIAPGPFAKTVSDNATTYYGKTVTNYSTGNETIDNQVDWQIFYSDEENIYLIAKDYIHADICPPSENNDIYINRDYALAMLDVIYDYNGSSDITDERLQALNSDYFTKNYASTNDNMKAVAYMLDIDIWETFVGNNAEYAIGGPTVEMLMKSYSQKYSASGIDYRAQASSATGYQISNDGGVSWANTYSGMLDTTDTQYVISDDTKASGMWLASPANFINDMMVVNYGGYVGNVSYDIDILGFRPIVCLNSDVTLKGVEGGFEIVEPPITAKTVSDNATTYYGKTVTNYTTGDATIDDQVDWQIFYSDEENIYLIATDYVANTNLPKVKVTAEDGTETEYALNTNGEYKAYFTDIVENSGAYKGSEDITNMKLQTLNKSYHDYLTTNNTTSTNKNMKAVAYMMDIDIWNTFAGEKADYAIGGPTVEMLMKSYSQKYSADGVDYRAQATSVNGYQISNDGGVSWANTYSGMLDTSDTQYVISDNTKAIGMWLASPSAYSTLLVMGVDYGGAVSFYSSILNTVGFRPLVCLNSNVSLKAVENGFEIE